MSGFEYCQIMQDMNETTHHRLEIWFLISVLRLYRGTLLRCRGGRWFTFRLILIQLSLPKSDLKVIAYLSFRLRSFQHEKRAPGEASRRHSSSRETQKGACLATVTCIMTYTNLGNIVTGIALFITASIASNSSRGLHPKSP